MPLRFLVLSVVAAGAALLVAKPGHAHLSVEPAFIETGAKERLVLTVHNDRDMPMSGFRLTAPDGLGILGTGGGSGWNEVVEGATAIFSGGALAPDTPATFEIDVEATAEPGSLELQGDQLYADGESVRWPVTLTVVPVGGSVGEARTVDETALVILSVLGLIVVGTLALVVAQRRRAPRDG